MNSNSEKKLLRLKILAVIFSVFGILLFSYFIYSIGFSEIIEGVSKIGVGGFLVVLSIHLTKVILRSIAWKNCVSDPHKLRFFDTFPAVLMGEAMSSMIPLGILASGTTKALAIRNRVPLVVGLSSVATENLFYSLVTGLLITFGAIAFILNFELIIPLLIMTYGIILFIISLIIFGFIAVFRQLHLLSSLSSKIIFLRKYYNDVKDFEDLIFEFYRKNPQRFVPLILLHVVFNLLGIFEVWFVLSCISETIPTLYSAFLLETISRLITIVFKLIPFVVGVDEAGANFISETLELAVGLGVTLAIIRKGRLLFFALIGMFLLLKRGLSVKEIIKHKQNSD